MKISIDSDLESFVMKEVEIGQYSSPSEVINQSLEMLRARKKFKTYTKEEIAASLVESEEQIARGEGREASEVFNTIRKRISVSADKLQL